MTISAYFLAFAGFVAIALSMPRHQPLVLGDRRPSFVPWTRTIGWILLAFSFMPCIVFATFSLALTRWFVVLTFSALTAILTMTYRPTLLRHAVPTGTIAALVAIVAIYLLAK